MQVSDGDAGYPAIRRSITPGGWFRRIVVVVVVVALSAVIPASASAQAPPLTGETLADLNFTTLSVTRDCNPTGNSTITYTVSGPATGPYPGTFTETGTVVIGPQTGAPGGIYPNPTGAIQSVQASFEITSAAGQVTGTKTYREDPDGRDHGICSETAGGDFLAWVAVYNLRYEAEIDAPTGNTTDTGRSELFLGAFRTGGIGGNDFLENFVSSEGPIEPDPPLIPTSKEQCKNGGWKDYPLLFKNQGDCVAFVATLGKNEPGQNVPGLP